MNNSRVASELVRIAKELVSVRTAVSVDAKSIFKMIQGSKGFSKNWDGEHAVDLEKMLKKDGWKYTSSHSKCTVANCEYHMEKGGSRVTVIQSNFMGSFTQVDFQASRNGSSSSDRVAQELVRIAKTLMSADPKMLLDELKSIEIKYAEGNTSYGLPTLVGKKFNSVSDMQKAISKFDKPDAGYDKCQMLLTFKDGSQMKNFRYDHGERDASFSEQLNGYIKKSVTMNED